MPYGLAALRIVSGLLFIEHGTQKLFGIPAPPAHGLSPLLSLPAWTPGEGRVFDGS
jgi:putative oxidoreductase